MSEEHAPEAPLSESAAVPGDAVASPPQPAEPGPAEGAAAEPIAAEALAGAEAPPAITPHTAEPGLLEAGAEAAKPAETAEGEQPPAPVAEPPAYEFAVPDGFTVPEERLAELRTLMTEGNVGKEHAEKLWSMHTVAMQELAQHTLQAQHDAFAEMRRGWRTEIAADPELGGAGFQTNQAAARRMLDLFTTLPALNGTSAEERTTKFREEINQFLSTTGATDHPALFRLLLNVSRKYDEPQSGPPSNPRPPAPREQAGRSPQGGRSRLDYTHPRGGTRTE